VSGILVELDIGLVVGMIVRTVIVKLMPLRIMVAMRVLISLLAIADLESSAQCPHNICYLCDWSSYAM